MIIEIIEIKKIHVLGLTSSRISISAVLNIANNITIVRRNLKNVQKLTFDFKLEYFHSRNS